MCPLTLFTQTGRMPCAPWPPASQRVWANAPFSLRAGREDALVSRMCPLCVPSVSPVVFLVCALCVPRVSLMCP